VPEQDDSAHAVVERFTFDEHEITEVTGQSVMRRFVLPIVGIRPDGEVESLGTAFCVGLVPAPVLVTAWHVVDNFIRINSAALKRGRASIEAVLETGQADGGRPIPVRHAVHYLESKVAHGHEWLGPTHASEEGFHSDVALLVLSEVMDDGNPFFPDYLGPIGFGLPDSAAWSYAFGYPDLRASIKPDKNGYNVLVVDRKLMRASGHVLRSFPEGPTDYSLVNGPAIKSDLAMPWGMSGGPVLVDDVGVCAVVSRALDPKTPGDKWTSYAVGLGPALDLPVAHEPGAKVLSLRDLVASGAVITVGELPPPLPGSPEVEVHRFTPFEDTETESTPT
jgi:hypothetical protein